MIQALKQRWKPTEFLGFREMGSWGLGVRGVGVEHLGTCFFNGPLVGWGNKAVLKIWESF